MSLKRPTHPWVKWAAGAVLRWVRPAPGQAGGMLRYWQEWVLRAMLLSCVVLGFAVLVPSVWLSVRERLWLVALVDILVYAWIFFVFVRQDLAYRVRSGSLVLVIYLLGVVLLVVVGPFGAGPVWLFAFPVIAGILMGRRMSVVALGINAATLIVTGAAIGIGLMDWPVPAENPAAKWIVSCINFMLLDALTTLSIGVLFHGLRQSLEQETALRVVVEENEIRLKTIFDTVHTGILLVDPATFQVVDANPSAAGLIGASPQAIVGSNCRDYLPPEVWGDPVRPGGSVPPLSGESVVTIAAGHPRPILISTVAVTLGGRPLLLASFLDISRLRQADQDRAALEAKLAEARKMEALGTLSGGIAHDFNNILASLIGFTELAREQVPEGSPIAQDLQGIFDAAQRARELVQQILAFSRRKESRMKPARVLPVLRETLSLVQAALPGDITVNTVFKADPVALIDTTQIHQIMMNLCTNARHAMKARGGILEVGIKDRVPAPATVRSDRHGKDGPWLQIWVADEGCGIAPDAMPRIFEPFFTTREAGEGSGMGLAVVHGIVEGHGGVIAVESEVGIGTRVHVYLPMTDADTAAPPVDPDRPVLGSGQLILVVDDDAAVLGVTEKILRSLNYSVCTARSAAAALDRLLSGDAGAVDLVMTDITMPEMTGLELLAAIGRQRPGLPVILASGDAGNLTAAEAQARGAAALAIKPLTRADLSLLVWRALGAA